MYRVQPPTQTEGHLAPSSDATGDGDGGGGTISNQSLREYTHFIVTSENTGKQDKLVFTFIILFYF